MKKIFLFLLILASFYSNAQSQDTTFTFTPKGFTDYVVTKIEGKSPNDLYKRAIDWVSVTYNNPNNVIKAKVENEYIRIGGGNEAMICMKALGLKSCNLSKYVIEISFKEGKYKFDLIDLQQLVPTTQYITGGWFNIMLPTPLEISSNLAMNVYFNDEGEPKKMFKFYIENIPAEFNRLNHSLKDFLSTDKISSQQNW